MIVVVCPKCGSELDALVYTTYPPVHAYRCRNCGWEHEERTNITQVPVETVERKPQSNGDRIRAMTDEELAIWMWNAESAGRAYGPREKKAWLNWLKQEAD